uniref:Uncharacterized protein n=1 Tax=Ditylenchus dipsaci TaxID=166011 RepID=A0A915DM40_9BILA
MVQAKHEQLLDEEYRIVQKGVDTTQNLLAWYTSRMESLEKRRKMLDKGMVALDTSVHEQKLNFYRAQITELNRRMKGLISSSERGFPSHQNMLRMPMAPAPQVKLGGSLGSSASSTSTNPSSSPHSSPEPQHTLHFFKQQHQKLIEELDAKSRLIEQLRREKRVQQNQQMFGGIEKSLFNNNNNYSNTNRPISVAAYVRPQQIEQINRFQPISTANNNHNCSKAMKIHDTLL